MHMKKTEVEVLSVVDLSAESAFSFCFVGDATQVPPFCSRQAFNAAVSCYLTMAYGATRVP